ncbi:MAG: sn-glycerol-3-phosphate ABC transporter ATP-binding protein UgpC [Rhodobacteraceae bacterium]|jgi:sn-glycerol 3-phosphate transport system ATP-binding protein|nr:sn-glycerol-3-phosphate ABC transporter ATP-binding protein UgpC [Paracoccaceae bacterium]
MAAIEIDSVVKTYPGGVAAVKGVSVTIEDGAFAVLVGPSGCGKSTILRMVAGLEQITAGEVRIGGRRVNELDPADRDIAMVFQNYALYPHMSVRENLSYGLRNRGVPRDEITRRVAATADILQIGALLDRKPRALSGGQRQRVAMGRAIVREPKAFLFDEPLSNLDAKLRVQMRAEIRLLQRRLGTTAIYVTHDQQEAMTMADTLIVLNAGRIEQVGAPLDVYRRPETTFVAAFIGSPPMNLLAAQAAGGRVLLGGAEVARAEGLADGPVTLGVRPEDLVPGTGAFDLTVDYVEELGAGRLVHGRHAGQEMVVAVPAGLDLGERLALAAARDRLHLFDHGSGRRLGG